MTNKKSFYEQWEIGELGLWAEFLDNENAIIENQEKPNKLEYEDDLESLAQKILDELLEEEDGPVSEEEKQEALDAIRAYLEGLTVLEFGVEAVNLEYDDAIELGVGNFLKKVWNKVKSVANKVVKKVTGKNFAEWKQHRRENRPKSTSTITVTTSDGKTYVWKEEDHPRDSSGRFASGGSSDSSEDGVSEKAPSGSPIVDALKEIVDYVTPTKTNEELRSISWGSETPDTLSPGAKKYYDKVEFGNYSDSEKAVISAALYASFGDPDDNKDFDLRRLKIYKDTNDFPDSRLYAKNVSKAWDGSSGGFSAVYSGPVIITGNEDPATIAAIAAHELYHSKQRKGDVLGTSFSVLTISAIEEPTTEILSKIHIGDFSDDIGSYERATDLYIDLQRKIYGDDVGAIVDATKNSHDMGNTTYQMSWMLIKAYPDLTRAQVKELVRSGSSFGEHEIEFVYLRAAEYHYKNVYGNDWQKYYNEYSVNLKDNTDWFYRGLE